MAESDVNFGAFESDPAVFTDTEAWVYQWDNVWRQMNPAEVLMGAALLSEADFRKTYGELPPLPKEAFAS